MTIDTEYLKIILDKFIKSETNFITTDIFKEMINEELEKFAFHWDLLNDKFLIVNTQGGTHSIISHGFNGHSIVLGAKVRLHDNGHQFYDMLCDDTAVSKIVEGSKGLSIDLLFEASKHYMNYKLENMFSS